MTRKFKMCCDRLQEFILTKLLYFPILVDGPLLGLYWSNYKPIAIPPNNPPPKKNNKQKNLKKNVFFMSLHVALSQSPRMSELEET